MGTETGSELTERALPSRGELLRDGCDGGALSRTPGTDVHHLMDARALPLCQGCAVSPELTGNFVMRKDQYQHMVMRALCSAKWLLNRTAQRATPAIEFVQPKDGSPPRKEYRNDDMDLRSETQRAIQTTALTRCMLAVAIIGAGLVSLNVASHVRGDTAPIEHVRTPIVSLIVPPGPETVRRAAALSDTQPSSPALSSARFRFGFLEFEDDADAAPR